MSELKEIGIRWEENGELHFSHVYLKSEADKVIAEKDAEIARLKAIRKVHLEEIESMGAGLQQDEEEILHHKYKRCLAMARWCRTSARCDEGLGAFRYRDWYWKWFKHWLQLAEKFKEGFVIGVDKATGTDKTVVINYKKAK